MNLPEPPDPQRLCTRLTPGQIGFPRGLTPRFRTRTMSSRTRQFSRNSVIGSVVLLVFLIPCTGGVSCKRISSKAGYTARMWPCPGCFVAQHYSYVLLECRLFSPASSFCITDFRPSAPLLLPMAPRTLRTLFFALHNIVKARRRCLP